MNSNVEREALRATKAARERSSHLGRRLRMEGTRTACPMCDASCEIRTSQAVTKTMRESFYQCTNVECGCTFVVVAEINRLLNPGATPNPKVNIPISSHVRRDMVRVMLDNAGEAEHQARYTLPVTGDLFTGGADTS
jgi:hypothetical protein